MSFLINENISLFDFLGNKFIILDQTINIFIRNIQDYNTAMDWDISNFLLNNKINNSKLEKYSSNSDLSNMKITFGNSSSSHGVIYNKLFEIDASIKYLLITYELDSSIKLIPFIRDQSDNLIYWTTKEENLLYRKIDGNKHIYLIKIPDLANTSIEKFKLYLFNNRPIEGSSLTISKFTLVKVGKLPKITINIAI
jgi:hypothetical protein